MGAMVRELMTKSPLLVLPVIAMLLFLAVFIGIALRTWRRKPEEIDVLANLPLKGDDQ
jgi:hypothetical protein